MALTPCLECKKEISDKAVICPQCGAPNQADIKTKPEPYESFLDRFIHPSPRVSCRICDIEVLRKTYICPNCGIRSPNVHRNRINNIGLFSFLYLLCSMTNYDSWSQWGTFYPNLGISVGLLISIGWLWHASENY
jgi:RNA polymerase subunit RPABC4/transcription elongation factor Spt4